MTPLDRWQAAYDAEIQRHRKAIHRLHRQLPQVLAAEEALQGAVNLFVDDNRTRSADDCDDR